MGQPGIAYAGVMKEQGPQALQALQVNQSGV